MSLNAKKKLAVSYVAPYSDTLHRNVQAMIDQGVATRSDLLTVDVKLNAANVDLVKVETVCRSPEWRSPRYADSRSTPKWR